jgi:hypothetical protein
MAEYRQALVKDGNNPEGLISFPIFITQQEIDALESFIVRDRDTFVVAYPKSGTTWMEQIVHLLANHGEQGDKILSEAVPWLEGAATRYGGLDKLIRDSGERQPSIEPNLDNARGLVSPSVRVLTESVLDFRSLPFPMFRRDPPYIRPLVKISRTGKMPIPQELFFLWGRRPACPKNR